MRVLYNAVLIFFVMCGFYEVLRTFGMYGLFAAIALALASVKWNGHPLIEIIGRGE